MRPRDQTDAFVGRMYFQVTLGGNMQGRYFLVPTPFYSDRAGLRLRTWAAACAVPRLSSHDVIVAQPANREFPLRPRRCMLVECTARGWRACGELGYCWLRALGPTPDLHNCIQIWTRRYYL